MLRSWETTEEKILCHLRQEKYHGLGKIYLTGGGCLTHSACSAICMRCWTGCARWLTVAVFLTKNPNLTLSKFWPPAPAEMRNSPLPTNGSFRQEIYVKKTLQHSPPVKMFTVYACNAFLTRENILCTFLSQTMLGRFCEMRTGLWAWLCHWSLLRSCQVMLGSGLLQNNEDSRDRVIGQWESSALRSELVLIFTARLFHYS